jgi:hypothetical protein
LVCAMFSYRSPLLLSADINTAVVFVMC